MQQFIMTVPADSVRYQQAIHQLIIKNDLKIELDIEYFSIVVDENQTVIGCVGLAGSIIKSFAIEAQARGTGMSRQMISEIIIKAHDLGRRHLSIFTSPDKAPIFQSIGFKLLTSTKRQSVLLVNNFSRLRSIQNQLATLKVAGDKIGAIVMNANPFTLGHAYLAEQAAATCNWLHIFVVSENDQNFSFDDRFAMVKSGTAHITNVTVHRGNEFIISKSTFPSYFLKDSGNIEQLHAEIDCEIFKNHIAPHLGITHRFVGSEPRCQVTQNYNHVMQSILIPDINVEVIERLELNDNVISASFVRKHLTDAAAIALTLLPTSTINYLIQYCGYSLPI